METLLYSMLRKSDTICAERIDLMKDYSTKYERK